MACCLMPPAISWTNVNKSFWRSCGIFTKAVSWEMFKISILDLSLKNTYLKLQPHLPGNNELTITKTQSANHVHNSWDVLHVWMKSYRQTSNISCTKIDRIPKLKCFLSHFAVVCAQSIEAKSSVKNEDVVGAAPTGDAPTTSEWSTISLPTKERLILQVCG